jgi:hypothetical protein
MQSTGTDDDPSFGDSDRVRVRRVASNASGATGGRVTGMLPMTAGPRLAADP